MKILLGFILICFTPTIAKSNVQWQELKIIDVIQLFNYERSTNHSAITVKEFDLPLIIDETLENCNEISAGNVINMQAILIPDPYIENPELQKVVAIKGCQNKEK